MIILKILGGLILLYVIVMCLLFSFYGYAFDQVDKTANYVMLCVNKVEWMKDYMSDQSRLNVELGTENARICLNFYNKIITLINDNKDKYLSGPYFTNKDIYKKRFHLILITEIFRSKRYRKIFKRIDLYINSLIDLIALEKRFRLKDKNELINYIRLKNKILKILTEIVV